jgi:hypothetical protein
VTFGEDRARTRTGDSAENFAALRHIALNLIKRHPAKLSVKRKRSRLLLMTSSCSNSFTVSFDAFALPWAVPFFNKAKSLGTWHQSYQGFGVPSQVFPPLTSGFSR